MEETSPRRADLRQTVAVVIPGIAALGLAVLYATGALLKTSQLRGADLEVADTLVLVPLQQVLALGIGVAIGSILSLLVWAGVGVFIVWSVQTESRSRVHLPPRPPRRRSGRASFYNRHFRWIIIPPLALILGVTAWTSTPSGFAGGVAGFMVGLASSWAARNRSRAFVAVIVVLGYLSVVGISVVENFVSPRALPRVTLDTGQREITGELVVFAEPTWFIRKADRTMQAIRADDVRESTIRSPERPSRRTIGHMIRGQLGL